MKLLHLDHYKQSTDYTCGPATLLSFLDYYDKKYTRRMTEMKLASRLKTCPKTGTAPKQLYKLLKEKNKNFILKRNGNICDLTSAIDRGEPSIVLWFAHEDWHWSTVVGYDRKNIILLDSYLHDGYNFVEYNKFNQCWSKLSIR